MRIEMTVELDYDPEFVHGEELGWFIDHVLRGPGLLLHSNEIGDTLGEVRVLRVGRMYHPADGGNQEAR